MEPNEKLNPVWFPEIRYIREDNCICILSGAVGT
jgi:hypothetical protein